MRSKRAQSEIAHGLALAQGDAELIWGWGTVAGQMRAQRRAGLIAAGAEMAPGLYALEIGCGTGLFTEMFARTGVRLVAVDISAPLLERAKARCLHSDKVQFLEKPFEDCEVDGPFDAVIGSSILHHLDIKPALEKIFNLLKPGGIMSFAEPNMMNPQIFVQKNVPWIKKRMGDSPSETAFLRRPLHKLLSQIGFTDVEIIPFDWLHPATPPALIPTVARIGSWFEKMPVVREFAGSLLIRCRRPEESEKLG